MLNKKEKWFQKEIKNIDFSYLWVETIETPVEKAWVDWEEETLKVKLVDLSFYEFWGDEECCFDEVYCDFNVDVEDIEGIANALNKHDYYLVEFKDKEDGEVFIDGDSLAPCFVLKKNLENFKKHYIPESYIFRHTAPVEFGVLVDVYENENGEVMLVCEHDKNSIEYLKKFAYHFVNEDEIFNFRPEFRLSFINENDKREYLDCCFELEIEEKYYDKEKRKIKLNELKQDLKNLKFVYEVGQCDQWATIVSK